MTYCRHNPIRFCLSRGLSRVPANDVATLGGADVSHVENGT